MWILLIGLTAGVVTTVAGLGGGTLTVLSLALLLDPLSALVISAPALTLGNGHRLWMYRRHVNGAIARRLIAGVVPGSLLGGLVATQLPGSLIQWMMGGMALLALVRALGLVQGTVPRPWLPAIGALLGGLNATSGATGPLTGALLQSMGLYQVEYIATLGSLAVALHGARLLGYGLGGAVSGEQLVLGVVLAAAVAVGNLLGDRLRRWMGDARQRLAQQAALFATLSLALGSLVT